jgi:uncharacterized membrane protein
MIIEKRKWLLLVSIIAAIGSLVILYNSIIETSEISERIITRVPTGPLGFGNRPRIPIYNSLLSSALLIVAIIPISYYFISKRFEERLERKFDVITKLMKKNNSVSNKSTKEIDDRNIILKFLNAGERKVVEALIDRKGEILQSEISRMEGMTKLKTHRAVRDLERKGVVKRENYGKTHRIILSKDVKEIILK